MITITRCPGLLVLPLLFGSHLIAQQAIPASFPLWFEPAPGQAESPAEFVARGTGYGVQITPEGVRLRLASADMRMMPVGADSNPHLEVAGRLPSYSNYLIGDEPAQWRTRVPNYSRVRYLDVYPGIDWVFYGEEELEYDWIVQPGADPSQIQIEFQGAGGLTIDDTGDLVIATEEGELRQHKPRVYQDAGSGESGSASRIAVEGSFLLLGPNLVGFRIGEYDPALPLVIDPLLIYSTYIGGERSDTVFALAADAAGNSYLVGDTPGSGFPLKNPLQGTYGGSNLDAFITKVSADGQSRIYSTYLGGSSTDSARGVAVDQDGNAFITGSTSSLNFPGAPAQEFGYPDSFLVKLSADGQFLVYGKRIFGGAAHAIAIDTSGNAYVAGSAGTTLQTVNAFQPDPGGDSDGFVAKISPDGTQTIYATYLGGNGNEFANGIAADSDGNAYVVGDTNSPDFPVVDAIQPNRASERHDAFVTKISADGSAKVFSTYLGGTESELGRGIAIDSSKNVYVTGETTSSDFPTAKAVQVSLNGALDGFVTKLTADGQSFVFSTFLGGPELETSRAIALDASENIYIAGYTTGLKEWAKNPFQADTNTAQDAFVAEINAAGSEIVFSSPLGGYWGNTVANGIAVDAANVIHVAGRTESRTFPVVNALQPVAPSLSVYGAHGEGFLTRIAPDPAGCAVTVDPTYQQLPADSSSLAVAITAPEGCAWTALETLPWMHLTSPASGSGNGTAWYSVDTNPSGLGRQGYQVVAGYGIKISQNRQPCNFAVSPASVKIGAKGGSGTASLTATQDCGWSYSSNVPWLSVSSITPSAGNAMLTYAAEANLTPSPRVGSLNLAGQNLIVKQGVPANAGVFRSGFYWLQDSDSNQTFNSPPDGAFAFGGVPGDIPLTGDWNGDGRTKAGIYRPENGLFVLDYNGDEQFTGADKVYSLGVGTESADIPVTGDWNGDGRTKIGLFRQGFFWILDTNGDGVFEQGPDRTVAFGGVAGDLPVVGDWNGNGISKLGLFRQGFFWILDTNGSGSIDAVNQPDGDRAFAFGGLPGDVPVVGDWSGDDVSKAGIFRGGFYWVLDMNGNTQFDGTGEGQDLAFPFGGLPGDKPIVGKW